MNNVIRKIKNDEVIQQICQASDGVQIYAVGGIIRDYYLDQNNYDKDIIVQNFDAEIFAKNLSHKLDATFIRLDEENKIYRLALKDHKTFIDVAEIMGKNIKEDLKRRDLTLNSIAIDLKTFEILDFCGGLNDLKSKTVRQISENNFLDDPLRLLRAFRFQSMLEFEIEEKTMNSIKKHAQKVTEPAIERINYELMKMFSGNIAAKTLLDMDKTGILKKILPITQELKQIPPNLHHHLDLFNHSIEVVNQIQLVYEQSSPEVKNHLEKIDFGGMTRLAHLKFAGLLHDIGKPQTWTIEEETSKHRFIKHDDVGSKMAMKLLKKNKYSNRQIEYISKMIKYHIYPSHVISAPEINEKIYMRLIRKMDKDVIDIIILAIADRLSARGPEITNEIIKKNIDGLQALLNYYISIRETLKPLPKLLSGEEIMALLNIKPSKELGELIKALKEAQLSQDVTTKDDAIKFINSQYAEKNNS